VTNGDDPGAGTVEAMRPSCELPSPVLADSVVLRDDGVHILDRRVFPFEHRWLHCRSVDEVAAAISSMVTQSLGPVFAVLWGLVLAARESEADAPSAGPPDHCRRVEQAAALLIATRPTNDGPAAAANAVLAAVRSEPERPIVEAVTEAALATADRYRRRCAALGRHAADLLPDDACVLTHCWADLYLIETVRAVYRSGKRLSVVCTETRPYLQGARLTAESLGEMGIDTTVITDGMGAEILSRGEVSALVTGADRVTMDGHVVNKVGTLGLAVAATTFGVPFHALVLAPDTNTGTAADVPIEYRDGDEVLSTLGHRTASRRVRGRYPAFDITPPRFVTTVVTDRGPLGPDRIGDYAD
jgi:methylthioribose-1-phosphate isomerase